ncbi:MAG: hypothetical protein QGG69_05605, partial [Kiritimatiellia bacterium]|nr:hypothetical protein [Kiritimatiellia bacterium]
PTDRTLEYGTPVYSLPFLKVPPLLFGIPSVTGLHLIRDIMRAYSTAFSCQVTDTSFPVCAIGAFSSAGRLCKQMRLANEMDKGRRCRHPVFIWFPEARRQTAIDGTSYQIQSSDHQRDLARLVFFIGR